MFIEKYSHKKMCPPSGGLCQPSLGMRSIGQRHGPPDGGRTFDTVTSINMALLTEGRSQPVD